MAELEACRRGGAAFALLVWYSLPGDGVMLVRVRSRLYDWLESAGCAGARKNLYFCPPWARAKLEEAASKVRAKLEGAGLAGEFKLNVWRVAVLDGSLEELVERALERARAGVEAMRRKVRERRRMKKSEGRYAERLAAMKRAAEELERWLACLKGTWRGTGVG